MSSTELLLSLSVLAAVLGGVASLSSWLRTRTAYQHTRSTLLCLHTAMEAYHRHHEAWPPSPTPAAVDALLTDPSTASVISSLTVDRHPDLGATIRDGFGQPLRYVAQHDSQTRQADFVSPGPDGRLGDPASGDSRERLAAADNLYSSDLETVLP